MHVQVAEEDLLCRLRRTDGAPRRVLGGARRVDRRLRPPRPFDAAGGPVVAAAGGSGDGKRGEQEDRAIRSHGGSARNAELR